MNVQEAARALKKIATILSLREGTWSTPLDSPALMKKFFSEPRLVGNMSDWETDLYSFAGNDNLWDDIQLLADDPDSQNVDIRDIVADWCGDYMMDTAEQTPKYSHYRGNSEYAQKYQQVMRVLDLFNRSPSRRQ